MTSTIVSLRALLAICVTGAVLAGGPAQPSMFHFPDPERELESRVNEIEAKQAISEQRQSSMAQSYSKEMSSLYQDTSALKTTVTRLVEDSVSMMGRIRILQDVGSDVVNLRRHVTNIQRDVSSKVTQVQNQVNGLSGKLDQLSSANTYITVGLSSSMKQNKDMISTLQSALATLGKQLQAAEQKVSSLENAPKPQQGGSSNVAVESLKGEIALLKETLQGYQNTQQAKIEELEGVIDELRSRLDKK